MIDKLLKYEIHSLNRLDHRYRFEVEETLKELGIRLYEYDKYSGVYLLKGNVMKINKSKKEFRSDSEFGMIKNTKIKAEIIRITCDYCNVDVKLGGTRYESNSEYAR